MQDSQKIHRQEIVTQVKEEARKKAIWCSVQEFYRN